MRALQNAARRCETDRAPGRLPAFGGAPQGPENVFFGAVRRIVAGLEGLARCVHLIPAVAVTMVSVTSHTRTTCKGGASDLILGVRSPCP
jgi:hypothetical protein